MTEAVIKTENLHKVYGMGEITVNTPDRQRQNAARAACRVLTGLKCVDRLSMWDAVDAISETTGYPVATLGRILRGPKRGI